ncbi:MAG: mechanosensitive ion channel [Deltaproteobacteria bacterium]|nr:mechanosensitive ion channel [Deltaproteobacteria bacterium]
MLEKCLIFGLLFLLLPACGTVGDEPDSWEALLKHQHRELIETSKSIDQLASKLPHRLSDLQKHLYLLRSRFERLMLYFDLRSGNPLVLRDILDVLDWFESETDRLILPFKQEKASVARQMENLADLSQKFRQEGNLIGKVGPQIHTEVSSYLEDLADLEDRLQPLNRKLTHGLDAAQSFTIELKKDRAQIERESNRVLKTHLVKRAPIFFSASAWLAGMTALKNWTSSFGVYLLEPIDLKGLGWTMFIAKIVLFSLLLMGLWVGFKKKIQKRYERLATVRLFPFFMSFSISIGALLGILSTGLFPSSFFSTLVTLILVYGLLSLSRNLHRVLFLDQDTKHCRLLPLWGAVSVCGLLVSIHLPEQAFIPVWSIWLLILCWYYARTKVGKEGWENISRLILVAATPILALMALLGWGYLSVLLGMLLFLLFLDIRLAEMLSTALGRMGPDQKIKATAPDSSSKKVRSLGFPLILLTLLLISFAWTFIFVGGGPLFLEVIRYRMGWESFTFSIYRVLCIFALLFVIRASIALARSALSKLPDRRRDLDAGSIQTLDTIVTYVLWSLFTLGTLGFLGLGLRNLAVVAGGLSVGLGFGLQNIVNNFLGGLILLFGRSIQPGDLLEIDNIKGYVRKVTIRNTLVRAFSGATIFVPNSLLISQKMINWSHADRRYRQEIKVGVAYGSDVQKVTDLLLEAAKQSPKVLDRPPSRVRFLDFGDSTLVFSLRVWIKGWADRYADSEVRYHIDRIFKENGIEISFPQLDLHIRSAEGSKNSRQHDS